MQAELLLQGVTVSLGQDDISDAYYPFGRNNMLEVAFLASHLLWMTKKHEIESLFEMITKNATIAMNLSDHKIAIGAIAREGLQKSFLRIYHPMKSMAYELFFDEKLSFAEVS